MTISAIIPAYNAGNLLTDAIESVLNQARVPEEIVVVDDGSTDGSVEMVCRMSPLIRTIRQSNAGVSAARNAGLAVARGDWIAFLDADDVWLPDAMTLHISCVEQNTDASIVGGISEIMRPTADGRFEPSGYRGAHLYLGAKLMRRDAFERVGLFDTSIRRFETLDWMSRANEAGIRTVEHDHLVLYYRHHSAGLTGDAEAMRRSEIEVVRNALRRRHRTRRVLL